MGGEGGGGRVEEGLEGLKVGPACKVRGVLIRNIYIKKRSKNFSKSISKDVIVQFYSHKLVPVLRTLTDSQSEFDMF